MPNGRSQRRRGFGYEREVVNFLKAIAGHTAERMWGSDGRSRGLKKEVDIVWTYRDWLPFHVQCKRTKKIAEYLKPHNVDMTFVREDRGETLVVLRLETLIEILESNGEENS